MGATSHESGYGGGRGGDPLDALFMINITSRTQKLVLTFECVTEGSVYDEQQYAAADSAKWRRTLLNPMLDEVANNLHTKNKLSRIQL